MALTTVAYCRTVGVIPASFSDATIDAWRLGAEKFLLDYVGYPIEKQTNTNEYYNGDGTPYIRLRGLPVWSISDLRLDQSGYSGKGPSAFASATVLVEGTDFILERDNVFQTDGGSTDGAISASGLVRKIGGSLANNFWPYGAWGNWSGDLVPRDGPLWPMGQGNLRVTYVSGFDPVPDDIQLAVGMLVNYLRITIPRAGVITTGERLGNYAFTGTLIPILRGALFTNPYLISAAQILGRYRQQAVAAA